MKSKNVKAVGAGLVLLILAHSVAAQTPGNSNPDALPSDRTLALDPTSAGPGSPEFEELLLAVDVNGQSFNEPALFLRDGQGRLYAAVEDLRRWRLLLPRSAPLRQQGADYYALDSYDGLQFTFSPVRLTIGIKAPAGAFESSTLATPGVAAVAPTVPRLGGFFNYELSGSYASHDTQGAGQFELGLFSGAGVGTMGIVAPELGSNSRFVRLDTTWNTDNPKERESWRFGDVINRAGAWGRSLRMGGVQFGSNFSTQPGFISSPLQQASGLATLPSTVDVYVNNALTSRRDVAPGPFSITNLPVVSGSGEVRLVVRDMLGREQVITQPFYASAGLLAAGLQDYSYEAGFTRKNFGISSNDYGGWAASATHRRGLTDQFTGELHLEMQAQQKALGVNGLYLLPRAGIVNATLAAGQSNDASGTLAALGFERQAEPLSFGVRSQWTSVGFRQLGSDPTKLPPARQFSANAGYASKNLGSFGLSYLRQDMHDQTHVDIRSASYSLSLQRYGSLTLSLIGSSGSDASAASTQASVIWTLALGADHSASVSRNSTRSDSQGNTQQLHTTLQKNMPLGQGYGYQLEAQDSGDARGSLTYQNNVGTYAVEAARFSGDTALRASVRGGVAVLGGQPHLSRWINDSFGVARVAGYPNVRVYADNQLVGLTNANGDAMLPGLRPYERNRIRIDARDLPLNAEVDALQVEAVPFFRSGVLAEFPVRPSNGALLRIVLDNGQPLPAGSTVEQRGSQVRFPVADEGEAYLTGLAPRNQLVARWKNQSCEFEVLFQPSQDPLPDLGAFTCKDIRP